MTTLDNLIRAVLKYMDERGMLGDLKKKYKKAFKEKAD